MPTVAALSLIVLLLCLMNNNDHNMIPVAEAVWLTIPSTGTKCVSEEIQNNVVVLADYHVVDETVTEKPSPLISARVTSPYGNNLHHNENVTHGQFAFTTSEGGNYMVCFWVDSSHHDASTTLSLDWRIGIAAKDWETVAKKDKIEGIELDLRRLEGLVQAIHMKLIYLKKREADMREVSEATNSRVAWSSIMSLGVCIGVSVLQLWGGR
ncbi:EMP24_GP25L domain-containing protein [Cephalotus follicularis]|uniref:EMP24_GP25L domain-containing protein n=1 Tax=Cephalotus follicularis TaxID=3775 RepID=A0A1Q3CVC3_CEPFO|nr:EMP24_GP25L domain-containing protein [Cephalotus follicularis]